MIVEVRGLVTYSCNLDEEKTRTVLEYARDNKCDLTEAVWDVLCDINIYEDSVEMDYDTQEIVDVEVTDFEQFDEIMEATDNDECETY